MPSIIDLTGQRFGKLVVLNKHSKATRSPVWKQTTWLCRCDCGNEIVARQGNLRDGNTKSCGCLRNEIKGMWKPNPNRCFNSWKAMLQRCYNQANNRYYAYGARGIVVCDEWRNSFQAFEKWSKENGYSPELTIDRIDVNGNYEPSNCRWATPLEQQKNKRRRTND